MKHWVHRPSWGLLLILVFGAPMVGADPQQAELQLWKRDPFFYGSCGHCADFYRFVENRDTRDFSEFHLYLQTGYYTAVLRGSAGTTVTLFGNQDFKTDKGFLIVQKKDDALVEIDDLEAFPPKTWTTVASEKGTTGSYSAYYHPYENFKTRIASVRWGRWWDSLPLNSRPPS